MSSLLTLPNELVSRVSHFVRAADLLQFALTSKLVFALTQDALNRHRELSKRYALLEVGSFGSPSNAIDGLKGDDTHHALLLLATILQDPDVAYHTKGMHIGDCGSDDSEDPYENTRQDILESRQSVVADHSAQLQQLVDKCPFVSPDSKESLKDLLLQPGSDHGAVCLLLTLLPNLKLVHLENWYRCSDTFRHIVGQIAEANQDPASPNHGKALSRLVECSMSHEDGEMGVLFDDYDIFAMLPSLRTLRGRQISGYHHLCWSTELRPCSSNITEIDFTQSAIGAQNFRGLLEATHCLKRFTYHFPGPVVGDAYYTPFTIIDVLRKTAAQTLELLDMAGIPKSSEEENLIFEEGDSRSIGSLHMFRALKKIRLEDTLFQLPKESEDMKESPEALLEGRLQC
ncbi:hypothetical protein G7Y79_00014g037430 [Physcia stellaris]|nr:hypothetical protein G7Y79_00014g037430 [Physcia stellaris]